MSIKTKHLIAWIAALCGIMVVAAFIGERCVLPHVIHWQEMRAVNRVMTADHRAIRDAGRTLLAKHPNTTGPLNVKDESIPKIIRNLEPRRVVLDKDSVLVDVGNVFNPFGITVFAEGVDGHGARKLLDGLWVFHDGQLDEWDASQATPRSVRYP